MSKGLVLHKKKEKHSQFTGSVLTLSADNDLKLNSIGPLPKPNLIGPLLGILLVRKKRK